MKKLITICFLLIGCVSLSAMQQTTLDKHGKSNYQNHEERLSKVEKHLQLDNRYYDHLSSYNANLYLTAEFLYWTAENEGWFPGDNVIEGLDDGFVGELLTRDLDYGPGVRVGIGFKPPIDWNLYLSWTYFDHNSKENFSGVLQMPNSQVGHCGRIISSLKIKNNLLDLEFGRPFHIGNTFNFRAHAGLRGGWLKYKGSNTQLDDIDVSGNWTTPSYVTFEDKYWLIGPRAGFDVEFFFSKDWGFSLYGNFSGALLYDHLDHHFLIRWTSTTTGITQDVIDLKGKQNDLLPTIQCALGLSWGDFITNDESIALNIRAGWEANYWWDHFNAVQYIIITGPAIPDTTVQSITEATIIQGLVVSARLDF